MHSYSWFQGYHIGEKFNHLPNIIFNSAWLADKYYFWVYFDKLSLAPSSLKE